MLWVPTSMTLSLHVVACNFTQKHQISPKETLWFSEDYAENWPAASKEPSHFFWNTWVWWCYLSAVIHSLTWKQHPKGHAALPGTLLRTPTDITGFPSQFLLNVLNAWFDISPYPQLPLILFFNFVLLETWGVLRIQNWKHRCQILFSWLYKISTLQFSFLVYSG